MHFRIARKIKLLPKQIQSTPLLTIAQGVLQFAFYCLCLRSVKVMTAESPLTSVDFMSDGATLAVGSTRGICARLCSKKSRCVPKMSKRLKSRQPRIKVWCKNVFPGHPKAKVNHQGWPGTARSQPWCVTYHSFTNSAGRRSFHYSVMCSSGPWSPLATNFCLWTTRKY